MLFQKKRNEEQSYNDRLLALVKQETDKMIERREELSKNLDLCIQGIQSIQRMMKIEAEV